MRIRTAGVPTPAERRRDGSDGRGETAVPTAVPPKWEPKDDVPLRFSCSLNRKPTINSLGFSTDFGKVAVRVPVGDYHVYLTFLVHRTQNGSLKLIIPSCMDIVIPRFRIRVIDHFLRCTRRDEKHSDRALLAWHEEGSTASATKRNEEST